MSNAKNKVFTYIDQNFEYVSLTEFKLLPGGTIVNFRDGSSLTVSYDFVTNEILLHLPSGQIDRVRMFTQDGKDPMNYYRAGVFEEKKED